jgi:hypothetical protein
MVAFWDASCSFVEVDRCFKHAYCLHKQGDRPRDGGSMHLWNVSLLQRDYTALYPRRLSYLVKIRSLLLQTQTQNCLLYYSLFSDSVYFLDPPPPPAKSESFPGPGRALSACWLPTSWWSGLDYRQGKASFSPPRSLLSVPYRDADRSYPYHP